MSSRTVRCNNCGQEFSFDIDRDFIFCEYCGTKILLDAQGEEPAQPEPAVEAVQLEPAAEAEKEPEEEIEEAQKVEAAEVVPEAVSEEPEPQAEAFVPAAPIAPAHPAVPERAEQSAVLKRAIACYNNRDYETANQCLKLLKENEPENFEVWFCECKVLTAEKHKDIKAALDSFVAAAANCQKYAPENAGTRGNLTIEFNHLLKNITDTIMSDVLYIVPYDRNVMSEYIPSVSYQPLGKVDEFYFMIMDGVKAFTEQVNPNYLNNYFLGLWDNCFFCFAHEITNRMVNDFNSSKLIQWYKSDSVNRVTNDAVFNAMCDLLYGYKNVFITLFNRLPYKVCKTNSVNRIAYINKWLLKMKRTDQYGRTYLLVGQPADRTALDQEVRNFKIMLSQS